jgi:hydrogenase-4 component E
LLVKGIIIPRVLRRAVTYVGLEHATVPYVSTSLALGVCAILVVAAFYVMEPITALSPLPTAGAIPLAFAGVLIGLFVTVSRRLALTQIVGFLALENGIFLFALLATYGVPFIVEIGVFLDLLVAVLIMQLFVYRIKDRLNTTDVSRMGELRG